MSDISVIYFRDNKLIYYVYGWRHGEDHLTASKVEKAGLKNEGVDQVLEEWIGAHGAED